MIKAWEAAAGLLLSMSRAAWYLVLLVPGEHVRDEMNKYAFNQVNAELQDLGAVLRIQQSCWILTETEEQELEYMTKDVSRVFSVMLAWLVPKKEVEQATGYCTSRFLKEQLNK